MAEQSVTAVLASLGMQYGLTSFGLAKVATDLAAGRSDQEIVRLAEVLDASNPATCDNGCGRGDSNPHALSGTRS